MKIVQLVQGSEDWLNWRRTGIGGSDAPIVLDRSPYKTPLQLYREKLGLAANDDSANEFIFSRGHKTEGLIRTQFQELTGVEMKPLCVTHEKIEYMNTSLDGFDSGLGVLEGKLVGQKVLEEARKKKIPDHHYDQIQHSLEVTEMDVAHWFGHDGKKNGVLVEIRRNEEHIKRLLEKECTFWEMVKSKTSPPLSERDYLIPENPEDLKLLEELREAKIQAENYAEYYDKLRAKVAERFKHPRIAGAGIKMFKVQRAGSVDWKSIPAVKRLTEQYIEKYRRGGSVSWFVTLEKTKVSEGSHE